MPYKKKNRKKKPPRYPDDKPIKRKILWDERFILSAYFLARDGLTDAKIAKAIGTTESNFAEWRRRRPALKEALEMGRDKLSVDFMHDWAYERLPPEMKKIWDRLSFWQDHEDAHTRINEILSGHGMRIRQHLFVHALIRFNFVITPAARFVGISPSYVSDVWKKDPHFRRLIEKHVLEMKKDFVEDAFMNQVRAGNPFIIALAAKTLLRDRGYSEKIDHKHTVTGKLDHEHTHKLHVSISELNLPIEVRQQVLEALREYRKKNQAAPPKQLTGDNNNEQPAIDIQSEIVS